MQRVSEACVTVEGRAVGRIGRGLLLFAGIAAADTEEDLQSMADKVANLRIFEDEGGRMNASALEIMRSGAPVGLLVVSQFTLQADVRRGRRPSFTGAASPDLAAPMIERFAALLCGMGLTVERGVFGAHMMVSLVNDGPVTIWIDSADLRQPGRGGAAGTS